MREEMNRRLAVIELFPARLANRVERDCGINVTGSRLRNSISLSLSLSRLWLFLQPRRSVISLRNRPPFFERDSKDCSLEINQAIWDAKFFTSRWIELKICDNLFTIFIFRDTKVFESSSKNSYIYFNIFCIICIFAIFNLGYWTLLLYYICSNDNENIPNLRWALWKLENNFFTRDCTIQLEDRFKNLATCLPRSFIHESKVVRGRKSLFFLLLFLFILFPRRGEVLRRRKRVRFPFL